MLGALPPIFAGLPLEQQQEAASFLTSVQVEPGEAIMIEGEEDATVAFVVSGTCEIWRGRVKVGSAGPRELIGEVELFGQMPRVCSVTAGSPVQLQALDPDAFVALADAGNPIVYHLERATIRRLGDRIARAHEGIGELGRGRPFALPAQKASLVQRLTAPFRKRQAPPEVDKVELLAGSDLFSWAPEHVLVDIADHFGVERFDADQVLCRQGEDGTRMFLLASGTAELLVLQGDDRAEPVATLGPGQAVGDASIALSTPRTATVVSRDEVVALTMERERFRELHEADDPGGSAFRQGIVRSLILQLLPSLDRYAEALAQTQQADDALYQGTPVHAMWRD